VNKVKEGFNIVVAGAGFGCGSSREEAPRALKGSGVLAVIAKSYAFVSFSLIFFSAFFEE
jgi:3-isopropylmalate dehydratase small subunit